MFCAYGHIWEFMRDGLALSPFFFAIFKMLPPPTHSPCRLAEPWQVPQRGLGTQSHQILGTSIRQLIVFLSIMQCWISYSTVTPNHFQKQSRRLSCMPVSDIWGPAHLIYTSKSICSLFIQQEVNFFTSRISWGCRWWNSQYGLCVCSYGT